MPLYAYFCPICEKEYEAFNSVSNRNISFCCDTPSKKLISLPNTHKDKAYEFITDMTGVPEAITSKTSYKKYLKRNNIIDASFSESRQEAAVKKKSKAMTRKYKHKRIAKEIISEVRRGSDVKELSNLMKSLKRERRDTE